MKLLFTDLDGTLLNDAKEISPENKWAIEKASLHGHATVITTGRSLDSALPYFQELSALQPLCYGIFYNGGLIYDLKRKETLFQKTLPLSHVRHIFTHAQRYGLHCQTYEGNYVLAPKDCPELRDYQKLARLPVKIDPLLTSHLTEEPYKILTITSRRDEVHEPYRKSLEPWARHKISMFYSSPSYLEHVPAGVDKGSAVRLLCSYLKVPVSSSVAAGDAENDISMLHQAGVGGCMSNGSDQAKSAADFVTSKTNDQGGIAEIIENFIEN